MSSVCRQTSKHWDHSKLRHAVLFLHDSKYRISQLFVFVVVVFLVTVDWCHLIPCYRCTKKFKIWRSGHIRILSILNLVGSAQMLKHGCGWSLHLEITSFNPDNATVICEEDRWCFPLSVVSLWHNRSKKYILLAGFMCIKGSTR